jgi:hypothetical protein
MFKGQTFRVEIESFKLPDGKTIALRPARGQRFSSRLLVEGNKSLAKDYPVGSRFRVQAALMQRPNAPDHLHSSWQWDVQVISRAEEFS